MSVSGSITLPLVGSANSTAQAKEVSLAGNGYWSPHSAWHVRFRLDADASGGSQTATIHLDQRWASMLAMVSVNCGSLAAAKRIGLFVTIDEDLSMGTEILLPEHGTLTSRKGIWTPQPQILVAPPGASFTNNVLLDTANVDTENVTMELVLYNFKKDAPKVTPITILNNCLPRGTSQNFAGTIS